MDPTTESQLTTLRQLLLLRLRDLRADLQEHDAATAAAAPAATDVADTKDGATYHQFAEIRDAEERRDIDELVCVEAALHRMENGTYGDCLQCGEPIPTERLLVQPAAMRCAACQSAFEKSRAARQA